MAERIASLYTATSPDEIIGLFEKELRSAGLTLTPQNADLVTLLDESGESSHATRTELDERLHAGLTTSFLWRRGEALDMYTRIRRLEATVVELGMKGLAPSEIRAVASALKAVIHTDPRVVGMVFDPEGATEDYDWDKFFFNQARFDLDTSQSGFPEAIAVRKRELTRVRRPDIARILPLADLALVTASPDWL